MSPGKRPFLLRAIGSLGTRAQGAHGNCSPHPHPQSNHPLRNRARGARGNTTDTLKHGLSSFELSIANNAFGAVMLERPSITVRSITSAHNDSVVVHQFSPRFVSANSASPSSFSGIIVRPAPCRLIPCHFVFLHCHS